MTETKFEELPDRIAETFKDRNILLTGGTGFLGRVMVERLLRTIPDFGHIYLLVRPKKGKDSKARLEEMFNSPLFEKVKGQRGLAALQKSVSVVNGDVSQLGLGLSAEDRQMLCEEIHIVYHAAATVRFDVTLKNAVLLNTRGTKLVLELAKDMKHLLFFAHISTAYCHLHEKVLGEKTYSPPADPHKIIKCVEWMEDEVVEAMTDKILGGYPNTYAFTKALAEGLVEEAMPTLPVVILRPSIVIPVWKEPLPGWTDNMNGPTGLLIGAGKGVIRTMHCNEDGYADYVPVDIAMNAIFACTWNYIYNKVHDKRVYNLTSSSEFKVSWSEIIERGRKLTKKVPFNGILWYPGGSMKKTRLMHNICVLLFHMIPAYFIDALIFLAGHKPIVFWHVTQFSKFIAFLLALQRMFPEEKSLEFSNEELLSWEVCCEIDREATKPLCKSFMTINGDSCVPFTGVTHYLQLPLIEKMCRVHRRINKGFEVFEFYANNQWDFENKNMYEVRDKFNATEKTNYQLHGDDMDLDAYFESCIRAARIYIMKELPETLPAARRHMRIMYWVDVVTKTLMFALLIYFLLSWSESVRSHMRGGWTYTSNALSF